MSDDDPEFPEVDIDFRDITIEGDPAEVLVGIEARIADLETALDTLDEDDPQRRIVSLELSVLRGAREALREQLGGDGTEGDR